MCFATLLALVLGACGAASPVPSEAAATPLRSSAQTAEPQSSEGEDVMRISVSAGGNTVIFELNGSQAARELYAQLPLSVGVENFSTSEKIFYPPKELDTANAPRAASGAGTLAYYAPWGDVVMFYAAYNPAGGLYELGQAVSGAEHISELSGTVQTARLDG